MKYKTTTIVSVFGLGITAAGFISVWVCDRFVKRRKQTKKMSIVFNDVVNDTETVMPLQTPISQKRTRARITSGMIRKWNMMAKKGMSHKQIAAGYGVSLAFGCSGDLHLETSPYTYLGFHRNLSSEPIHEHLANGKPQSGPLHVIVLFEIA